MADIGLFAANNAHIMNWAPPAKPILTLTQFPLRLNATQPHDSKSQAYTDVTDQRRNTILKSLQECWLVSFA